ncbi:MAG: PD-(D/E)XK nuclease family protein [Anaeroplasmataceae bacterium]|nr:PD-(D/E)XK nuclease family protein [Anaeroplasmataceae bacterium]
MELKEGFIICSDSFKEKILRETHSIQNYIFLTPSEFKKRITFRLKKSAVFKLMKHYGFSYSISQEYEKALERIEDKTYNHPKLDSIVSVYRYLKQENLVEEDPLFLIRLRQFPVTFIDPEHSKEYEALHRLTASYTEVYEVEPVKSSYVPVVYEFKTALEECLYVMNQVKELLRLGISLNHIYLANCDEDYIFLFRRLGKAFGIPIQFDAYKNISSAEIVQQFLKMCEIEDSFSKIIQGLDSNNALFSVLIDILNEYELEKESPKECLDFLKAILKKRRFPQKKYEQAVCLVKDTMLFSEEDYVFYVGCNLGSTPRTFKEDGFLNDKDLALLGQTTSLEQNELAYQRVKKWFLSTPHLTITYKLFNHKEMVLPAPLLEDLGMKPLMDVAISYGYAQQEDELRLVGLYDLYLKYGQWHKDLEAYGIGTASYKSFNHSYKPIEASILKDHFDKKPLRLAYSNVKLYFACPFSYYADRILGLNEFKPQMAARMGTFAHAVLEDSYAPDFNFDTSASKHQKENALDGKDAFFFQQMVKVLRNLIEFNQEHERNSQLNQFQQETHIEVTKEDYTFEGYIDKLMYTIENGEVYAAIVDYKTGADIVSLDNIEDGFHLQLPSYMYLLSKYEAFKGLKLHIIGIYLQKVNIVIFDTKSDIEVQMSKKFMLEGYSVANPTLLKKLDPTYEKSTYIKSLGMGKDGFLRYSKIFLEHQQDEIISMVDQLLDQASDHIHKGEFKIAPKKINEKNVSCMFCKYKDLCFYEYEDLVELTYKPFGKAGEQNGMD